MLESYKWMGWVWDGMGMGWKSLRGVILRAPLCGANKDIHCMFVEGKSRTVFFPSDTLIYGISRDGSKIITYTLVST